MLPVQLRQMLQVCHLEHLVPNRLLMQPQSLDFALNDADHFDAAECSTMLAGEVSEPRCLLSRIGARIIVGIEDVDLNLAAFAAEHEHVRIEWPRLALSVG